MNFASFPAEGREGATKFPSIGKARQMQDQTQEFLNGHRPGWEISVSTPEGQFPTASAAAKWHGVSHGAVINRLRSLAFPGWTSPVIPKWQSRKPLHSKKMPSRHVTKTLDCLQCGSPFDSDGPGNRLCDSCRSGDGLPEGWHW